MRCVGWLGGFVILGFLVACSDSSTSGTPDAAPGIDADDTARCLIAGAYGDLGAKTGTTAQGPTTLTIVLDAGPPRDSFFLKLTSGQGAFAGGLANGTFAIAGADADFNTCGLCVNIIADIVSGTGPTKFYFATSGSVTLTGTSPPAGMLENVSLREVTVGGAAVPGGCTSSIDAMTFSM